MTSGQTTVHVSRFNSREVVVPFFQVGYATPDLKAVMEAFGDWQTVTLPAD